jgi:hypothetical protein
MPPYSNTGLTFSPQTDTVLLSTIVADTQSAQGYSLVDPAHIKEGSQVYKSLCISQLTLLLFNWYVWLSIANAIPCYAFTSICGGLSGSADSPAPITESIPVRPKLVRINHPAKYSRIYFSVLHTLGLRLPPFKGVVPFCLGIICMYCGWVPLRENRGNGFHFILFIVSLVLTGYGFLVLLPWSVS